MEVKISISAKKLIELVQADMDNFMSTGPMNATKIIVIEPYENLTTQIEPDSKGNLFEFVFEREE